MAATYNYYKKPRDVKTTALTIATIILLIYSTYEFTVIGTQNEQIRTLGESLSSTEQALDTTQKALQAANNANAQLRADVEARDDQINQLGMKVNDLNRRLGLAEEQIAVLTPTVRRFAAVGVREDGTGVVIPIEVKLVGGEGAVSMNIKNVDLQSGVQASVRTAVDVAESYTRESLDDNDITVSFVNEGPGIVTVDGGSAGAAVTVTIIAAIQEKDIRGDVLMTGAINPNGSIGVVGGVFAKAEAARDHGARFFLVPSGQSVDVEDIKIIEVNDIDDVARVLLR